jgi:cytochrome c551/c552
MQSSSHSERRRKLKKAAKYAALVAAVIGIGIQFIPIKGIGSNPPHRFKLDAPPQVEAIMRKACFDCHTNETRWPWYAKLAPGSWLMARDVLKGRSRMNMSEWGDCEEAERTTDRENSRDQIDEGEMPPWFYLPMHPDARLSKQEKDLLKGWLVPPKASASQAADSPPPK